MHMEEEEEDVQVENKKMGDWLGVSTGRGRRRLCRWRRMCR